MALLDMQTGSLLWWEKTIEYMFVRDVLPESSLAVPLAGPVEAALGDMVFADSTQCRLIEFKAHQDGIQREKRKFPKLRAEEFDGMAFQLALLNNHDELVFHAGARAHWFVFGEQAGSALVLRAQKYSEEGVCQVLRKGVLPLEGVSPSVMADYMLHLAAARRRDEAVSGGGGMVYCAVANGSIVPLPSEVFLRMACRELQLSMDALNTEPEDPAPGPTLTPGPSGP